MKIELEQFILRQPRHLIYFDAFSPDAQPEMWAKPVFAQLCQILLPGGLLVTYSSKGMVRRTMKEVGFIVTKRPGATGKREMISAKKPDVT